MIKKNRGLVGSTLLAQLFTLLLALLLSPLQAQDMAQILKMPLPVDPEVRIGKLDNGMTYYIRANKEPKERAEFYIYHHVGAILEEDSQNGLAHFTEHMAFNGTKRFPGKNLLTFLEHNGVKFGADVNAFTGMEQTCYNISDVPTTREGLLDSCMMVLCDWSGDISLEGEEIDNERGVICEELRTRENANWRSMQLRNNLIFKGSKYAKRNVIGTLDLLKSFPYSAIRDFYHKWYRPDLQAIIVVGDFDAAQMEARVKKYAGALAKRTNPTPKPVHKVPQASGVEYAAFTDPEMPMTRIEIHYKRPTVNNQDKNVGFFLEGLKRNLVENMMNARFNEVSKRENAPFVGGYCGYYNMVDVTDLFTVLAVAKPGESKAAYQALVEESQRARQNGFTATELARAKSDLQREYQKEFEEKDKTRNSTYVNRYIDHFHSGQPIMDAQTQFAMVQQLLQTITPEDAHATLRELMPGKDLALFISASDKEKSTIPTQAEAEQTFNSIFSSQLQPWVDNVKNEPLIKELPKPGSIKKVQKLKNFDAEQWTLSNGVRILVKPTDFKQDEVRLYAMAEGGKSLIAQEDLLTADLIGTVAQESGLGNFDAIELEKLIAGKKAAMGVDFGTNTVEIEGRSGSKIDELELLFQQIYLAFTAPRFDQKAFNTIMEQLRTLEENRDKDPNTVFNRRFRSALYDDHPRSEQLCMANLDKVKFERMLSLYNDQMHNAQNFTFVIVGNVEPAQLKTLVNLYLGSLPKGQARKWKDVGMNFPEKPRRLVFSHAMEMPKTRAAMAFSSNVKKYDLDTRITLETLEHILDLRYTKEIREDEGGTYGVSAWHDLAYKPKPAARMYMIFDTDPEKQEKLVPMVSNIFLDLVQGPATEDELNKAKQHFLKAHPEHIRTNGYWMNILREWAWAGVDFHTDYEKKVQALTTESLKKDAEKIFTTHSSVEVIMNGYKAQ